MPFVKLSLYKHRQQQVVLIQYPADKELTVAIRLIKTSKWRHSYATHLLESGTDLRFIQ